MKRRIAGLAEAAQPESTVPDGLYLVQLDRIQYRFEKRKPFYALLFSVLEPKALAETNFSGRLYLTEKALWKLAWFLKDFGYESDCFRKDELEERNLVGLRGVIKISHATVNGRICLNLDAFARASDWDRLRCDGVSEASQ